MRFRRPRGFVDTRLSVNREGDWRAHTSALPRGCQVLGTVTTGRDDTGALVRLATTGCYVKVKGGKVTMLDQARIKAALAAADGSGRAEMVTVEEWERERGGG